MKFRFSHGFSNIVLVVLVSSLLFVFFNQQAINQSYTLELTSAQHQYQLELSDLEKQKNLLIVENQNLISQNQNLILSNQDLILFNQNLISRNQNLVEENQSIQSQISVIITDNQKLNTLAIQLSTQQNSLIQTVSEITQLGYSKPPKVGYTPIFKFTLDAVDKTEQQNVLSRLSNGSYCQNQEIVKFNLDDLYSWKDLGDWKFTGYTATVAECDADPSTTANGSLVTPGFTMAVDHKYWKYGTIFYIDGFGFAIAADCGSSVNGKNRGDYLVASRDFCYYLTGDHQVWLVFQP